MPTQKETVQHILEQLAPLNVRSRAMFGGYTVYCDEKPVALVCNDVLFVKPTEISEEYLAEEHLAPPYQGAKDHYGVPEERIADTEWLQEFVQRTADLLPVPKKRSRKRST